MVCIYLNILDPETPFTFPLSLWGGAGDICAPSDPLTSSPRCRGSAEWEALCRGPRDPQRNETSPGLEGDHKDAGETCIFCF